MSLSNFLVASAVFVLGVQARNVVKDDLTTSSTPAPLEVAADIPVADYTLTLSKRTLTESLSNVRRSLHEESRRVRGLQPMFAPGRTANLSKLDLYSFAADVTWGNQSITMFMDTGSADVWLAETGFVCYDYDSKKLAPDANCTFGDVYNRTETLRIIPDSKFNKQYGLNLTGEHLQGVMALETLTMVGLSVENQEFGLVNNASWRSSGYKSAGLIGLAYPSRTNALRKNATGQYVRETYDTFFSNLWKQAKIPYNLFSMILNRDDDKGNPAPVPGYLSFGGVPDVPFTQNFTSTPIRLNKWFSNTTLTNYMILLDGVNMNGKRIPGSGGKEVSYIIDSGTPANWVPTVVLEQIAAAFSPQAKFELFDPQNPDGGGQYQAPCNASTPVIEYAIEGTLFRLNKQDVLREVEGKCYLQFIDGGNATETFMIIGAPFLHNVVSVYDVGASMMRFAPWEC
ncbi:hypothetical protein WAI453_004589 [Rhynchosporium graminicola]|uniref:Peptidase A1 domain-containing protein n=1 Tax=Rhynchosporium graminicola TaxID=2792576 RepID=A0A1E1LM04_9HELO|nr:uncharacterized protein RCO7_03820 [Rhynchosporium commune]